MSAALGVDPGRSHGLDLTAVSTSDGARRCLAPPPGWGGGGAGGEAAVSTDHHHHPHGAGLVVTKLLTRPKTSSCVYRAASTQYVQQGSTCAIQVLGEKLSSPSSSSSFQPGGSQTPSQPQERPRTTAGNPHKRGRRDRVEKKLPASASPSGREPRSRFVVVPGKELALPVCTTRRSGGASLAGGSRKEILSISTKLRHRSARAVAARSVGAGVTPLMGATAREKSAALLRELSVPQSLSHQDEPVSPFKDCLREHWRPLVSDDPPLFTSGASELRLSSLTPVPGQDVAGGGEEGGATWGSCTDDDGCWRSDVLRGMLSTDRSSRASTTLLDIDETLVLRSSSPTNDSGGDLTRRSSSSVKDYRNRAPPPLPKVSVKRSRSTGNVLTYYGVSGNGGCCDGKSTSASTCAYRKEARAEKDAGVQSPKIITINRLPSPIPGKESRNNKAGREKEKGAESASRPSPNPKSTLCVPGAASSHHSGGGGGSAACLPSGNDPLLESPLQGEAPCQVTTFDMAITPLKETLPSTPRTGAASFLSDLCQPVSVSEDAVLKMCSLYEHQQQQQQQQRQPKQQQQQQQQQLQQQQQHPSSSSVFHSSAVSETEGSDTGALECRGSNSPETNRPHSSFFFHSQARETTEAADAETARERRAGGETTPRTKYRREHHHHQSSSFVFHNSGGEVRGTEEEASETAQQKGSGFALPDTHCAGPSESAAGKTSEEGGGGGEGDTTDRGRSEADVKGSHDSTEVPGDTAREAGGDGGEGSQSLESPTVPDANAANAAATAIFISPRHPPGVTEVDGEMVKVLSSEHDVSDRTIHVPLRSDSAASSSSSSFSSSSTPTVPLSGSELLYSGGGGDGRESQHHHHHSAGGGGEDAGKDGGAWDTHPHHRSNNEKQPLVTKLKELDLHGNKNGGGSGGSSNRKVPNFDKVPFDREREELRPLGSSLGPGKQPPLRANGLKNNLLRADQFLSQRSNGGRDEDLVAMGTLWNPSHVQQPGARGSGTGTTSSSSGKSTSAPTATTTSTASGGSGQGMTGMTGRRPVNLNTTGAASMLSTRQFMHGGGSGGGASFGGGGNGGGGGARAVKEVEPKYSDPLSGASPTFQQRLMELAALEAETVRWERTKKIKKKPKQDRDS